MKCVGLCKDVEVHVTVSAAACEDVHTEAELPVRGWTSIRTGFSQGNVKQQAMKGYEETNRRRSELNPELAPSLLNNKLFLKENLKVFC